MALYLIIKAQISGFKVDGPLKRTYFLHGAIRGLN